MIATLEESRMTLAELATLSDWASDRKRCVEVGTWKGRSAYALCEGLPEDGVLFCVDDFSGDPSPEVRQRHFPQLERLGGREEVVAEWRERMIGYAHCCHLIEERSEIAAGRFGPGELDLVFLDGCRVFEQVLADFDAWTPKLKRSGVFCGWDCYCPGVTRALLERFPGHFELGPGQLWRVR